MESIKKIAHAPQALGIRAERRRRDSNRLSAAHVRAVCNNVHYTHNICNRYSAQLHLSIIVTGMAICTCGPLQLCAAASRQWAFISTLHALHVCQDEPVHVVMSAHNQTDLTILHIPTRLRAGWPVLNVVIPLLVMEGRRSAHHLASLATGKLRSKENMGRHSHAL